MMRWFRARPTTKATVPTAGTAGPWLLIHVRANRYKLVNTTSNPITAVTVRDPRGKRALASRLPEDDTIGPGDCRYFYLNTGWSIGLPDHLIVLSKGHEDHIPLPTAQLQP